MVGVRMLLALAVFLQAPLFAQTPPPSAEALVTGLNERLAGFDGVEAELVQIDSGPLGEAPPQQATLWFSQPDLLRVDYHSPVERTVCARGDSAVLLANGGPVRAQASVPLLLGLQLLGDPEQLSARYTAEVTAQAGGSWRVTWRVNDGGGAEHPRLLVLELSGGGALEALEVRMADGRRSRAEVSALRPARAAAAERTACAPD